MNRRIKLLWDFRGPTAAKTAEHHAEHLSQFVAAEKLNVYEIDTRSFSEYMSVAYMVVDEKDIFVLRDALKPHRAEVAR